MKKQFSISLQLAFLVFTIVIFSQNERTKESIQAKIKLIKKDNFVTVYAEAINSSKTIQDELNFSLLSIKKNNNGKLSKKIQSDEFSLMIDEVKTLSKQQLNINEGSEINVYLFIRKKKNLISKDSLKITAIDDKYSSKSIEEPNLELSGLIIENVMTKLGKDFYDYFSQINQLNNNTYPFIIVINEKPALGGRNSEISIYVQDNIIYKFRTQPKDEFLYNNAKEANRIVYNYNIKRKLLLKRERLY